MSHLPLISIGIPTYNRSKLLGRAIESAMAQDYPHLEILISDNVSTDDTEQVCAAYAARDPRIRYIRQSQNRGATGNFRAAFENTRGELFAWLGDDDWIDPTYVRRCAEELISHPDYSVVAGRVRFYADDKLLFEERPMNLLSNSPSMRVKDFFREVVDCGIFYGLIRRTGLEKTLIRKVPGFDWLITAALASTGKLVTLDDIAVHRATGGATKDFANTAASLQIPLVLMSNSRSNHIVISSVAFQQIAWACPAYRNMNLLTRFRLGIYSAGILMNRFVIPNSRLVVIIRRFLSAIVGRK